MDKNKERMNNIEKQVEYIVETYGHAPEEAAKKICTLFSVSGSFYIYNHIATNAEFGCIAETHELALDRLVNELGYKKEEFEYKHSHVLI
ncbi:MAG: hypothetical protein CMB97_08115 [Flavobacteriaceae bacterium]|nr:hypothetical protein [Flavobacteriaceae bacterium]